MSWMRGSCFSREWRVNGPFGIDPTGCFCGLNFGNAWRDEGEEFCCDAVLCGIRPQKIGPCIRRCKGRSVSSCCLFVTLNADAHATQVPAPAIPDALACPVAAIGCRVSVDGSRRKEHKLSVVMVMTVVLVGLRRLRSSECRKTESCGSRKSSQSLGSWRTSCVVRARLRPGA